MLFLINHKWANIFPVFARLDPHLIKLAHYVTLWLVEENQLFNSQTWTEGAGGAQRAAHLISRTLISYKASCNFLSFFLLPCLFFQLPHMQANKSQQLEKDELHIRLWVVYKGYVFGKRMKEGCGWLIFAIFNHNRHWWLFTHMQVTRQSIQETTPGTCGLLNWGHLLLFSEIKQRAIIWIFDSTFLISTPN